MDNKRIEKFNKTFPWFLGLSGDLLFWFAIDTLFLTVVKNFNASQVVSLTSISLIVVICLQLPLLEIIKKIGNTNSVRLSAFLLLLSSILITFGGSYFIIVVGKILYEIAFTFQDIAHVILKNNLKLQNRSNQYIKVKTKANTIYAIATMFISFIASILFNINNYLPMLLTILFCLICFILSFNIIDFSDYNKVEVKITKKKTRYNKMIIVLIISYGLFLATIKCGQSNGKLFIQEELFKDFDVESTALILGAIVLVSRIGRVFSNVGFNKIYSKLKEKVGIIFPVVLLIAYAVMLLGDFITNSLILKFTIIGLGYIIILSIRDPFKVYMQDLALKNIEPEYQQTLITTMETFRKTIYAIISSIFTLILINSPIILIIFTVLVLSIIEIFVSLRLYRIIKCSKIEIFIGKGLYKVIVGSKEVKISEGE